MPSLLPDLFLCPIETGVSVRKTKCPSLRSVVPGAWGLDVRGGGGGFTVLAPPGICTAPDRTGLLELSSSSVPIADSWHVLICYLYTHLLLSRRKPVN